MVIRKVPAAAALAVVPAVFALMTARASLAGQHYVDPCTKSVLCAGLGELFEFDEMSSDFPRFAAFGSYLNEPLGGNVTHGSLGGDFKTGAAAVIFNQGTSRYLWSVGSGPGNFFTIALWVKPSSVPSNGTKWSLMSWDTSITRGPDFYLESNGTNLRACFKTVNLETDATTTACTGYSLAASTYYHLAFGSSGYFTGQNRIWVSLNAGTKTTAAQAYYLRGGRTYFRVAERPWNGLNTNGDQTYGGNIDQLALWSRELSPEELSLLYNSGNGRAYPFDTGEFNP